MKNLTSSGLLIALITITLFGCSKDKDEEISALETGYTNDEVINAAKAYLPSFKSSITDDFNLWGFNSPSELDQILIGSPILSLGLTADFRNDSIYDCFDKYIVNDRKWRVPLMVGSEIRCFLDVRVWNGSLQGMGGGANVLAKKVDDCLREYRIESQKRYIIEEHVYGNCILIMIESGDNFTIYPVRDYLPIGDWNPNHCRNLDKVYYSFDNLFYEFNNESSCFPIIGEGELN